METTRVVHDSGVMRPLDEESASWVAGVNQAWAENWLDPREDVYTAADGEPIRRNDNTPPGDAGPPMTQAATD